MGAGKREARATRICVYFYLIRRTEPGTDVLVKQSPSKCKRGPQNVNASRIMGGGGLATWTWDGYRLKGLFLINYISWFDLIQPSIQDINVNIWGQGFKNRLCQESNPLSHFTFSLGVKGLALCLKSSPKVVPYGCAMYVHP